MQHHDACGVLLQIMHGILAADNHPAAIQLEVDFFGIGVLQQHIVRQNATDRSELSVVVVIGEAHTGVLYLRGHLIELISAPAPIIKAERSLHSWLLMHRRGADHKSCTQRLAEWQYFVEMLQEQRQRIVRAHAAQAGRLHSSLYLLDGHVEKAGSFDFLITEGSNLL